MTGQELRQWRDSRGLSQAAFAALSGVGRDRVGIWEKSAECPPIASFAAWCYDELKSLEQQLTMLESGAMRTGEKRLTAAGIIDADTTSETLARIRQQIAELGTILGSACRT